MFNQNGVNYAANLPAHQTSSMQELLGHRLSQYIIKQIRRRLPIELFLMVDSDIDICQPIKYMCVDDTNLPKLQDSAVNGPAKRYTIEPDSFITFHGFQKSVFEVKIADEQLTCINRSSILRQWFNDKLEYAVEVGRDALLNRFYRELSAKSHPRNTGQNAGLTRGGNDIGSKDRSITFNVDTADIFMNNIVDVIKQMPTGVTRENEFGMSASNGYIFAPSQIEQILMRTPDYNHYRLIGDCNMCGAFTDTFQRMPRGLFAITSDCIERYTCNAGGANEFHVWPVLFGKRYMGAEAKLAVDFKEYSEDREDSTIYRFKYLTHMHVYDPRYIGKAYINIEKEALPSKNCN